MAKKTEEDWEIEGDAETLMRAAGIKQRMKKDKKYGGRVRTELTKRVDAAKAAKKNL